MRRRYLSLAMFLVGLLIVSPAAGQAAAEKSSTSRPAASQPVQEPITIHDDGCIVVRVGESRVIMNGVQPCLGDAGNGVLVVQSQVSLKPYGNRRRINHYPWRVANRISRDYGQHWEDLAIRPDTDPPFVEGGMLLRRDGAFLILDTYITPIPERPSQEGAGTRSGKGQSPSTNSGHSRNSVMGTVPSDEGEGDLWISRDACRTIQDPVTMKFRIPGVDFDASKDDGGREHRAIRLHRSVLELPNGDLLTTAYGCFKGDKTPCPYQPKMMKSRCILFRSRDGGKSWDYVSTIAVGNVGSEGFDEPVLCRLSRGEHAGRLICMMRTGSDLYQAISDDEGATWSAAAPVAFPGIDLHDVDRWKQYVDTSIPHVKRYPVATGAIVDPDLMELDNGVLVCAGARIPEKACFRDPRCPRNGNYLAFSRDQGKTWSHVVQLTSGVPTTHYMAIRQIRPNQLYVTYDLGSWGRPDNRIMGCTVDVASVSGAKSTP